MTLTLWFTVSPRVMFESNVKQGMTLTIEKKDGSFQLFESNVKQGMTLTGDVF